MPSAAGIWGVRAEWDGITIRDGNDPLLNAAVYCKPAVIFDAQGGTEIPMQALDFEACAVRPEDPVHIGCVFGGWYTAADGTGDPYDFSQPVYGDVTLYALWITPAPAGILKLPATLTEIEADAFQSVSAEAVIIPGTVGAIVGNPFAGSGVQYVYGYQNSAAQALANSYPTQFTFVPIDDAWLAAH